MEEFSFSLNENEGHATICIDEYKGGSEKVIFPLSIGGIPVTAIGNWAIYRCVNKNKIKQIILPEGLTYIGCCAFKGCTALTDINLPEGLTSIEDEAFKDCVQLTNINLPKGLVDIGYATFTGCGKLTEFTVDENNPVFTAVDGVLFDKTMTTLISFPGGKKGDYAIPDGVFDVEDGAFKGCNEITRIHIPQSGIGYFYFEGERLADITVSEQNHVYSDIDGVLFNKEGTVLIKYPQGRENKNYTVPGKVNIIKCSAFGNCKCLADIILPEGLQFIEGFAFLGCERLTAVNIYTGLHILGNVLGNAYRNYSKLETITLSRNTRIGYKALKGFSGKLVYRD